MASRAGASPAAVPLSPIALDHSDPQWRGFLAGRDDALAFHDPAWVELLADCYGYRPFVLALANGDRAIRAGLPVMEVRGLSGRRRWISLPFSDVCPPLLTNDVERQELATALDVERRRADIASFKVHWPLDATVGHRREHGVFHTLQLSRDVDAVFATFHPSQVRRNIRRAEREGVVVRRGESEADLARTYYGLHVATRSRLGAPVQPRRFFTGLWRRLLDHDRGFVLLAYEGERPIAGAVFLAGSRTLTYKYGASDSASWHLRPNHAIFATAIRHACEAGFDTFDFGRTDLDNTGLRAFKSGWGAQEEPLGHSILADRMPRDQATYAASAVRGLLRHSPQWVCRATGELLYRYAP